MFRKIYLSPFGFLISIALNGLALFFKKPFMVYGFFNNADGRFYKKSRISSSAVLVDKRKIDIRDHAWIGHYCLLDGIGGITIEEGVNIASHTCIYTHSSHDAIRLMGRKYIEVPAEERIGYAIEGVRIGAFSFVGTSCVLLPGTVLGKGCIVGAGSVVKGNYPDYSVIVGNPAKVIKDTREIDKELFLKGLDFKNYYNPSIIAEWNKNTAG